MAGVKPSKFINYISQFKKLLVTRNNGAITQKFKIDSNITDDYYFSIVNSKNQLIDLTGRSFKIYGSIIDAKEVMHILFYSSAADISTNGLEMHFKIDTYTSQYMTMIKNDKVIDLTIVEVIQPQNQQPEEDQITQVILRDQALAYKRPYIQNQVPAEILERVILTTNVPLTGAFGAGQEISLTMGSNGAAFGTGLDQTGNNQLVIGQYNEVDNTKAFVIGNGSDDSNRSNAFTVDYLGNVGANAISATSLVVNGTPVTTQGEVEAEFAATSAWANETFETKTDAFNSHNGLQSSINNLRAELIATSGAIESDIPTKVSQLANDSGYITGYNAGTGISIQNGTISLTGQLGKTYTADEVTLQLSNSNQFSIKSLASKLNQGQNVILTTESDGSVTINAIGGGGGGAGGATYLAGLGLSLSTVSAEDAIYKMYVNQTWLDNKIEQATSDIQNLSAGTGLAIEDNVISLTATIPSIDGLASEEWVEANFLSAIPSNYATKDYVDSSVSGKADINDVYTKEEVYTYIETDVKINEATSGKADLSAVQAVDDKFANYYTSAQVDQAIADAVEDIPSTVYTGEDGIKVEDGVISLTATIPTAISDLTNDSEFATSAQVSSIVEGYGYITDAALTDYAQKSELESVSGQLTNAIGAKANTTDVEAEFTATSAWANETFLTEHQSLDDYYNKTQVDTISSNIVSQIPTDVATSAYVQAATGNAVSVATGWVDDQNYLTEHQSLADYYNKTEVNAISTALSTAVSNANYLTEVPSEYITETELVTELEPYAQSADVTTAITNATSGKVNKTDFDTVSSALSTAIDSKTTSAEVKDQIQAYGYQTATDVANAIAGKADKTELQTVSGTLTSQINGVSERVGTIEADYIKSADMTATSTWVNNTFETQANALTAYNDLTGKINTASTTLTSQVDSLSTAMDNKFTATSGWANGKFETIENVNALTTRVKAIEDDYTTSAYVTGQVNDLATGAVATNTSNIATVSGKVEDIEADYVTSSVLTAYVNNQYVAVSQLANDVGYITAGDLPAGTVYLAGEGLKLQNAVFSLTGSVLSGDGTTIAINNNVISVIGGGSGGKTYTGGTGIEVDNTNNTISLSATIPTAISDLTNDSQFATSAQVSAIASSYAQTASGAAVTAATGWVNGQNYLTGMTVGYYDTDRTYTVYAQCSSLSFSQDFDYVVENDNVELYPKGIRVTGEDSYGDTNTIRTMELQFNTNNFVIYEGDGYASISLANSIPTSTSQLTNDSGFITASDLPSTVYDKLSAGDNIQLIKNEQTGVTTISAANSGGGGSTYTAGTGIDITNDEISVDQTWFDDAVSSLVSSDMDAAASAAVESYIDLSGLATGTGLLYDDTDNSLNINLSADANSNMAISADNSGVVWLSAVGGGGSTYTAGTGLKLEGTEFSLSAAGANENKVLSSANGTIVWADNVAGGGSNYTAGDYISLENDTIAVTGLPTNQQIISAGFTYNSKLEIAKNTYTPTDGVITLSAFEVPAGSLDSNKVAIFEEWVYAKGTLTGITFDGVTLTNELPSEISQTSYYVFTRRILGSGEQFIKYEYKDIDWNNMPLTFTGKAATNGVRLNRISNPNAATLNYSKNGGEWTAYSFGDIIGLSADETVAFSGNNSTFSKDWDNYYQFAMTGTIEADGNIQSLMNFSDSVTDSCYVRMFSGCSQLVKAPKLPATTIAPRCYAQLFQGTNITTPPALPATTLGEQCYRMMFYNCFNLTSAPQLPATELAGSCYNLMFNGCTSISSVSVNLLPATTLQQFCYHSMFNGCTSLSTAPQLPATTLANYCYYYMFGGCTSLITPPPVLPATGIVGMNYCYRSMFEGCTNLVTSPDIKLTTIYNSTEGMAYMFNSCSKLSNIRVELSGWGSSDDWVNGVASNGTFYCPTALGTNETITRSRHRCPANWTVINI